MKQLPITTSIDESLAKRDAWNTQKSIKCISPLANAMEAKFLRNSIRRATDTLQKEPVAPTRGKTHSFSQTDIHRTKSLHKLSQPQCTRKRFKVKTKALYILPHRAPTINLTKSPPIKNETLNTNERTPYDISPQKTSPKLNLPPLKITPTNESLEETAEFLEKFQELQQREVNNLMNLNSDARISTRKNSFQIPPRSLQRRSSQPLLASEPCAICNGGKFNKTILSCGHSFCKKCISKVISLAIENNEVPILCPQNGCQKQLITSDIWQIMPVRDFWCYERKRSAKLAQKSNVFSSIRTGQCTSPRKFLFDNFQAY